MPSTGRASERVLPAAFGGGRVTNVCRPSTCAWIDQTQTINNPNLARPPATHTHTHTQVEILRRLDHPNVVAIHQFYRKDPKNFYVVLESLAGGELFDRIVEKVCCSRRALWLWLPAFVHCQFFLVQLSQMCCDVMVRVGGRR